MNLVGAKRNSKRQILKDIFGFDDFRPRQEEVVDALLAGRSVLTVMPTGSGKSLCYQVPALVLGGLTIVVSPLVALMQDQVSALRLAGVAADTINSSKERAENVAAWRRAAAGKTRLLYLAPERLMTEQMLAALAKLDVRLIAIDEAHCISQWGPAFRPEYETLSRLRHVFPDVPIAALTATADEATRADIAAQLFAGHVDTVVLGFDRPNIKLTVETKHDWKRQLLSLVKKHAAQSGIVYCLSRKKTGETAAFLADHGIRALPYHAGMSKELRDANQNSFMTEPYMVMVATIAFGMGIDKSDVRFVFHADLPGSLESYYQEIGRAGREASRPRRICCSVSATFACVASSLNRKTRARNANGAKTSGSTRCSVIAKRPVAAARSCLPISAKGHSHAAIAIPVSMRSGLRTARKTRERFSLRSIAPESATAGRISSTFFKG